MSWPVVPLEEFVDSSRPITYGIVKPGQDVSDGVPYIRVVDMRDGGVDIEGLRRTSHEIARSYRRSTLRSGDLLVSIRGHVGRTAFVPSEATGANLTQDTARVAVKAEHDARFVRWFIESPAARHWMAQHTKGVAVTGINLEDLRKLPVPRPSRSEQQFVADILDRAETVHRKRSEARVLAEELARSSFLEMFGHPVANPLGWPTMPFSKAVRDATGGNAKVQRSGYQQQGCFPIIDQGAQPIGGWTSDSSLVANVRLPAVLFGDHTKNLKWADSPFVLGADGVKILEPRDALTPEYLYSACTLFAFPDAGYSRHFKFLKLWSLPVPPIELQTRFACLFRRARAALPLHDAAVAEAFGLRESLAARAFAGELTEKGTC